MKTGIKGIEIIKRFEGCKLTAYRCPANVWTIGYGHTQGVRQGMVITQSQADSLLKNDLVSYERDVLSLGLTLSQNQFDALVSLCYNIGITKLRGSTLVRTLRTERTASTSSATRRVEIERLWLQWSYAGGKILQGLRNRRIAECQLFFS